MKSKHLMNIASFISDRSKKTIRRFDSVKKTRNSRTKISPAPPATWACGGVVFGVV